MSAGWSFRERVKEDAPAAKKAPRHPPAVRPLGPKEKALRALMEAACGYARQEGKHVCKLRQTSANDPSCDPLQWDTLRSRISAVLDELMTGREG